MTRLVRETIIVVLTLVMLAGTGWALRAATAQMEFSVRCATDAGHLVFTLESETWTSWVFTFDPPRAFVTGHCVIKF